MSSTRADTANVSRDVMLGAGLACMAFAAGLCQFVFIGLAGVALFPLAVMLIVKAGSGSAGAQVPAQGRSLGMALLVTGGTLLAGTAWWASSLSYDLTVGKVRASPATPVGADWAILGISSVVPALLIALGLRRLVGWPVKRCVIWGLCVLSVCPVAVLIFRALDSSAPLTT